MEVGSAWCWLGSRDKSATSCLMFFGGSLSFPGEGGGWGLGGCIGDGGGLVWSAKLKFLKESKIDSIKDFFAAFRG